jgi:hypothetical protein
MRLPLCLLVILIPSLKFEIQSFDKEIDHILEKKGYFPSYCTQLLMTCDTQFNVVYIVLVSSFATLYSREPDASMFRKFMRN